MPPVSGCEVRLEEQPTVVGRQAKLGVEDHAPKRRSGHADAFLAEQRTHRVKGEESWHDGLDQVDGALRLSNPRIGRLGGARWWGNGSVDLPGEWSTQGGVLGQEVIEDGRAGAVVRQSRWAGRPCRQRPQGGPGANQ